jgi:hypothetical protein
MFSAVFFNFSVIIQTLAIKSASSYLKANIRPRISRLLTRIISILNKMHA